ncbi:DNA-binding domain-containing protein [Saccharospirillum impatiens]|uniref:HvfC/BufC N-terminal domain-containing protein n=1 Tax=Saccharospirillum impatiens TaxID=169438 RepID=UPI00040B1244|nr:DNA-binding domain-containing protein [Saccharospirillum impatiens]
MHDSYQGLSDFLQQGKTDGLHQIFTDANPEKVAVLYRNGYLRACREALEARFPAVAIAMGDSEFRSACYAFTREAPPTQRTLTCYGSDFPDWLAQYDRARLNPVWPDLARLDNAWLDCLYGLDETPLTAIQLNERLQSVGGLTVSPRLPRNACLVPLDLSVFDAWVAIRQGAAVALNQVQQEPGFVLFWRPDMTVFSRQLNGWEVAFYRVFLVTGNLEKAVSYWSPPTIENVDYPVTLDQYFAQLIKAGLLTFGV